MENPIVYITVFGGMVMDVSCSAPINYVVIDHEEILDSVESGTFDETLLFVSEAEMLPDGVKYSEIMDVEDGEAEVVWRKVVESGL